MEVEELLRQKERCPNCREGSLIHESDNKWSCPVCGYWSITPPIKPQQEIKYLSRDRAPPLSSEQKQALESGREHWKSLIAVSRKTALSFLTFYTLLPLAFNIALSSALTGALSLSLTITAWVATGSLGLLSVIMFYIGSTKKRIVFGLIFGALLALFIYIGRL